MVERGVMKIGDLIEVGGDNHPVARGVIIGVEKLYPRHPESPLRNVEVDWVGEAPSFAIGAGRRTVNVFAIKKVFRAK